MSEKALTAIRKKIGDFKPKHAILLGSGLGDFVKQMSRGISISYADIPDFRPCTVSGHGGSLEFGFIGEKPIVCLAGRPHYYEGAENQDFLNLIRTVKLTGAETFISVSAVGSLHASVEPGEVVLIHDHINLHQKNPLIGFNDESFGPRFISLENLYHSDLRTLFHKIAKKHTIPLHEGIYISVLGPVFETPAEIRAYRLLGADVVGMSTVPEVIVAHHSGMKVAVLAAVTNLAAGMQTEPLSHEGTLRGAKLAADKIKTLLLEFVRQGFNS